MLLVDERAHGQSEGTYIGFGCLDRLDALKWIQWIMDTIGEDVSLMLHWDFHGRGYCADDQRS